MTSDRHQLRPELTFALGITASERADVIAACIQARGLRGVDDQRSLATQTAARSVTLVCGRPHPRSEPAPELAFIYATTYGPLWLALVVDRHEPIDGGDQFEPPPSIQHAYLLARSRPDLLVFQCRTHGRDTVDSAALLSALPAAGTGTLTIPTLVS